jgi:dTDP-4-amino-4,6-dideoxygalactose transaminase
MTAHSSGAFDESKFAVLARVEDGNPWFDSRNRLIQWALRRYAPDARDLLEVGCGTGYVLQGLRRAFPALRVTGLDAGADGLRIAHERVPDATLVVGDARRLSYGKAFDVVCAFDVLEHVDDDSAVLMGLRRALRPGGVLLATVPQHAWLWSGADVSAGHHRRYERKNLVGLIERAGFRVLRVTSFVSLLLPVLAAVRLSRGQKGAYDLEADCRPRPLLDGIARAVYAAEHQLISAGLSLPAGGSLLVVAQLVNEPAPRIVFNRPHVTGDEFRYISEAIRNGQLSAKGPFTARCDTWLAELTGSRRALLTHSCTAALEMSAILSGVGPGDEVILPSFTFVTSASAFALRGATPVFVDIRPDTLDIDESLIEATITPRTKAIVAVHYAGVGCEMDAIMRIARRHGLVVIEDAAQGLLASYRGRALGSIGALGALSFHETKNIMSGEGGALLVNDPDLVERAEIILEKGTDRRRFERGEVAKYSWVDIGSSYAPSEIIAAFLWAQSRRARELTDSRLAIWERYHAAFADLEARERIRRPIVPPDRVHNAHMYYLIASGAEERTRLIQRLAASGVDAVFHYVPLHSSPAGRRYGRASGVLAVTDDLAARLVRLPLWTKMPLDEADRVIAAVRRALA